MNHHPKPDLRPTRRRLILSSCLAGAASVLYACATPTYPTDTRAAAAAPPPARAATPAPVPAATPAPAPPPDTATPAPPPTAVESQPLPPPPSTAPQAQASTPPPSSPAPRVQASAPPPAYAPPAYVPPERREVTRTVAGGQVVSATHMFRDYVVRKGDHLDAIARDFDVSAEALSDANHLKSPDALRPGQHIKIPVAKAYVVQSGDTMAAVAKRFDLGARDLAELNDMGERDRLRSGDRLALPADARDHGPTRVTETMYARQETYRPRRETRGDDQPLPRSGIYTPATGAVVAIAAPPPQYHSYSNTYSNSGSRYAPIVGRAAGEAAPTLTDAEISAAGKGRFVWPVRGETLARFGAQGVGRRNDGLDVKSPAGTVVRAAAAGEVVYAGNQVPGFGNLVLVKHADGWVTAYAHLERASVQMRQTVMQGQEIGEVGASGGVPEPELHFEVRYAAAPTDKAKPVDPLLVLPE